MELVIFIIIFGLVFDYTNGFHDAANVVSTVIATRALTPLVAIILAGFFNFIGATYVSGVATTIAEGLVDAARVSQIAILSAILGAILWNLLTWYFGIPSSSSYALIGALIGSTWFAFGKELIFWNGLAMKVIIPMFVSPLLGFSLSYLVMKGIFYVSKRESERKNKLFRYLQIASSSLVALAHGMNDAQKSMGIITLGLFSSGFIADPKIPLWVIMLCALVIGLGTAGGGFRIIHTVGFKITKLATPQGFAAEASASSVILLASLLGMPISSTQMIAGSVAGVGAAKKLEKVRWVIARQIALTWLFTLPGSAIFSIFFYELIHLALKI
ncbi:MAG: inorganic phosphate transporter [Chlamydiae bacterium]|nr:inorganic phosphate transporter [Chlamydiota bacterium]